MTIRAGIEQKPRRGFNLIESAIVLGVVGVVLGALWVTASAVMESYKVNKTVEGLALGIKNFQALISMSDGQGLSDITQTAIKTEMLPKDWIHGTTINPPIAEYMRVQNNSAGEAFSKVNAFYLYKVPRSSCIKLAVRMANMGSQATRYHSASAPEIGLFSINGNYYYPPALQDPKTANTACNQSSNTFVLSFGYTRIN